MTSIQPPSAFRSVAQPSALRATFLGLMAAAMVAGCGGGGGPNTNSTFAKPVSYPALTITSPSLSAPAHAGVPVQFEGGVCGGGNGQLSAAWNFGDNTPIAHSGNHTYAQPGWFALWVQCTDTAASPVATVVSNIQVLE